ncbi:putative cell division control protein [Pseudovirgaria hyperparasitica]|uniref:Putative cell division control protein n=1 Tax=Pseudovirgaria hyperparasitica TaxID=470096 RepID=A0A6A6WG27_9PEZI|nr:putative cell division control protein [Pseudovirgaria hyperparasitica]KAF2761014.1 putative cell division control protein [Pseudovirgaria hyperparasitica]
MPSATATEPPSVSLSFANNFWGKDDAGVSPLLERMHNAKVTGDELKSFYAARAAIEDEYARKLLNLARKPLGSSEAGTLRMSLDVIRGEVESTGKAHQNIAQQMKTELEEQLAAFAGGMKERRKIVQNGIEKLLKLKMQQTSTVNKARDRYEQDCLKIKGFLAQAHMVMGQEERKNKAKLEKTQIQLSTTSSEYEAAVKVLEETTGRWNRDWKAACDKFQDLEEERVDFMKSSLWTFANIASTVCVSDDASCEKIRLSLEDCDVEKDIISFIKENGTGQEIPDPPKFIDFCRGDASDNLSDADDNSYSVAQFQRTMNPAFRTSSPQPSLLDSHHDPNNVLAREFGLKEDQPSPRLDASSGQTPLNVSQSSYSSQIRPRADSRAESLHQQLEQGQFGEIPKIPYNEHPMDGMTQFCRSGGPPVDRSQPISNQQRPPSRDDHSDYSNPASYSSADPQSGMHSPTKQMQYNPPSPVKQMSDPVPNLEEKQVQKKKSGFFQGHSPFRRRSKHEKEQNGASNTNNRNTWSPTKAKGPFAKGIHASVERSASPEPIDPRANFQLNVGNNVFDVASPDKKKQAQPNDSAQDDLDPIAQALAELKGVGKQGTVRQSADRYAGLRTPAPPGSPNPSAPPAGAVPTPYANQNTRGTPPPSYNPPMSRLGAPQPAHTAKQMQQTTEKYVNQARGAFNGNSSRPTTRGSGGHDVMRATSPAPPRATSPRPGMYNEQNGHINRSTSPNPYGSGHGRPRAQSSSPIKQQAPSSYGGHSRGNSPNAQPVPRAASPNPQFRRDSHSRPLSRGGEGMALQLAPGPSETGSTYGGSQRSRDGRPMSSYYGSNSGRGSDLGTYGGQSVGQVSTRVRSKSVAEARQYTPDGRAILHYARAMYMYQAQIPEELSFAKGDVLAVLRLQDDGWWEAEVVGKASRPGLVPSNYLQNC